MLLHAQNTISPSLGAIVTTFSVVITVTPGPDRGIPRCTLAVTAPAAAIGSEPAATLLRAGEARAERISPLTDNGAHGLAKAAVDTASDAATRQVRCSPCPLVTECQCSSSNASGSRCYDLAAHMMAPMPRPLRLCCCRCPGSRPDSLWRYVCQCRCPG